VDTIFGDTSMKLGTRPYLKLVVYVMSVCSPPTGESAVESAISQLCAENGLNKLVLCCGGGNNFDGYP
jgi:hypothetical protein